MTESKQTTLISEKKDFTEEQLTKELSTQVEVMREILEKQEQEKQKAIITNPSAMALSTTRHSSGEGIDKVKKTARQLFTLYLTNQFVARAISIRADAITTRGYNIIGNDEKGMDACNKLIEDSGGGLFIWQLATNAYIAGDAFNEKIYNLNHTKISKLKQVHPLTMSFRTDPETNQIVVGKDKEPVGYVQYYTNDKGVEVTKNISKDIISHFKFNALGDEFTGLSAIQPGYDTIVRLMNMEYSAAEAAVKIANPIIVGMCNTKSPHQIAQWGTILGNINGRDQVFIPEGMKLDTLQPGQQNFSAYAEYFLDAVVAAFGVPKGVLLGGTSGTGNRAQDIVLTRHFYSSIRTDQKSISDFFNIIFKEYAKLAGFEAPKMLFEDIAEDSNVMADSAIKLFDIGIIDRDEARELIGLEAREGENVLKSPPEPIEKQVKENEKKAFFPEEPGKPAGSQKGIKTKQKKSPLSEVSNLTK